MRNEERAPRDEIQEDQFIFEHLRVYRRALALSIKLIKLAITFPVVYSRIRDQLIGAGISAPLNLAEGSGRVSDKDKKNFYRISRASLFELIPIIDIIHQLDLISNEQRIDIRREIVEISRITAALMK